MTGLHAVVQFDSFTYLECAANLAAGRGPLVSDYRGSEALISHWPPLYPAAIAAAHLLTGLNLESAALAVNMAGLAATLALMAAWLKRAGPSASGASVALLILAVQPDFLMKHASANSEALFLPLLLGGILCADQYRETRSRSMLIAGAALAGAAVMTRYAGLALVPFAGLLWLDPSRRWQQDWRRIVPAFLAWTAVALLPIALWRLWLDSMGSSGIRQLAWHPVKPHHLRNVLESLSRWFFTPKTPWPVGAAAFGLTLLAIRRKLDWQALRQPRLRPTWLFALAYFGFLLLSISVADHLTPLDTRILLPCFIALYPAAVVALARPVGDEIQGRSAMRLAPMMALLALLWAAQTGYVIFKDRRDGRSYGMQQRRSMILPELCALDRDRIIYSNVPGFVQYYCQRPALSLPTPVDEPSLQARPTYEQEWRDMESHVRDHNALLAFWTFRQPLTNELTLEAVLQRLPMERIAEDATGMLLQWNPMPPPAQGGKPD